MNVSQLSPDSLFLALFFLQTKMKQACIIMLVNSVSSVVWLVHNTSPTACSLSSTANNNNIEQGQQFESMVFIITKILAWRNKQANKNNQIK